jgi:hypothetical protein
MRSGVLIVMFCCGTETTIFVGQVLDAVVSEVNGRIVRLSIDHLAVSKTQVSHKISEVLQCRWLIILSF